MALIKADNSDQVSSDAVVFNLGDLHAQAERILAEANREAQSILEQARSEAEQQKHKAASNGYTEGYERGRTEGRQHGEQSGREEALSQQQESLSNLEKSLLDSLRQWTAKHEQLFEQARTDVLIFALELGKKIIHRQIKSDFSIIQDQLKESLSYIAQSTNITIAVHPDSRALAEQALPDYARHCATVENVDFIDDPILDPGGCVISTSHGTIDASIQTQLDRVAEMLLPHSPDEESDL